MHPHHTELFTTRSLPRGVVYFLLSFVRLYTVANRRPSCCISAMRHSTFSTPASQHPTSKPSPNTAPATSPASSARGLPPCRPLRQSSCAARAASACASPPTRHRSLLPSQRYCITLSAGVAKLDTSPWRIGIRIFRDCMDCTYRPRSPLSLISISKSRPRGWLVHETDGRNPRCTNVSPCNDPVNRINRIPTPMQRTI